MCDLRELGMMGVGDWTCPRGRVSVCSSFSFAHSTCLTRFQSIDKEASASRIVGLTGLIFIGHCKSVLYTLLNCQFILPYSPQCAKVIQRSPSLNPSKCNAGKNRSKVLVPLV